MSCPISVLRDLRAVLWLPGAEFKGSSKRRGSWQNYRGWFAWESIKVNVSWLHDSSLLAVPNSSKFYIHHQFFFCVPFIQQMDPGATEALKTRMGWALRQLRRGYTWIHKVAEPERGRIYIDVFFLVPQIFKKANTHLTRNETSNCSIPLPKAHWRIRQ